MIILEVTVTGNMYTKQVIFGRRLQTERICSVVIVQGTGNKNNVMVIHFPAAKSNLCPRSANHISLQSRIANLCCCFPHLQSNKTFARNKDKDNSTSYAKEKWTE